MYTTLFNTKIIKTCLIALVLWSSVGVAATFAATLSVSPGTGVFTAGNTFTARVVVNTTGASINAAEGTLSFNPSQLSVVGISKGSIFNLWTAEPSFSNSAGTISFSGGSPSGYTGSNGAILNVTFRSKGAGNAKVSFTQGSVLAADGRGTNVLTSMSGGAFTIAAADTSPVPEVIEYIAPANTPARPEISSDSHDDPAGWYAAKTANLSWTLPPDVTAVRTLLDENSGSIPTRVYDDPISSITLDDLEEGVQYFHLQFKNADGWGRVAHYRLAVDSQKPESFKISLSEDADLSNPVQTIVLDVEDTASVVDRFLVQIDGAEPFEFIDESASGTLELTDLEPGHHTLIIEAFDEAGNSIISTFSFAILAFDRPQFTDFPSQINSDVIPVIAGITRPNAEVTVILRQLNNSADGSVREYTVMSNESGVFNFIPDSKLSNGVYEISAVAVDQYGAKSEPSDAIRLAVQDPGYIRVGSIIVSFLSVLLPLVGLLLLFVLLVWYFVHKLKRIRKVVTKETNEALGILSSEFAAMRETLSENESALAKSRKTKKLTKAEAELVTQMKQTLDKSEEKIKKEIDDVDDVV